jgi:hypothetical protein
MSVVRAAGPGRASLIAARRLPFDTMSPHPLDAEFSLAGMGDGGYVREFSCVLRKWVLAVAGRFGP